MGQNTTTQPADSDPAFTSYRYEELVKFLFSIDTDAPIEFVVDGMEYIIDEEQAFAMMDEYKESGQILNSKTFKPHNEG